MRTALCFYGLAGGIGDKEGGLPVDCDIASEYLKLHIIDKNNVDIFIHTWSTEKRDSLIELYNPVDSIFEKQKMFDTSPSRKHSIYSRWYSTKRVIELKRKYEINNNFNYDCVFVTRFDVAFFSDIILYKYKMDRFYLSHWCFFSNLRKKKIPNRKYYKVVEKSKLSKLLKNIFYRHRHQGFPYGGSSFPNYGGGVEDFWFFSNSNNIDKFSKLFDNLDQYLNKCNLSNHILLIYHLDKFNLLDSVKFELHRFSDFALVRRKFLGHTK